MGKVRIPALSPCLAAILLLLLFAPVVPAAGSEASPRQPAWTEPDVDRPGADFTILWLRGGPEACREACAQNSRCRAYTYVREGVPGRMEGCWLKDAVPAPVENGCCVSGVKTGETVSRAVRAPAPLPPGGAMVPPRGEPPAIEELPPDTGGEEAAPVPLTGSGTRDASGARFAAVPHEGAAPKPSGVGRRVARSVDFVGRPASGAGEAGREGGPQATGTGFRRIHGVRYKALPLGGAPAKEAAASVGTGRREVSGVVVRALPPQLAALPVGTGRRAVSGVVVRALPPQTMAPR